MLLSQLRITKLSPLIIHMAPAPAATQLLSRRDQKHPQLPAAAAPTAEHRFTQFTTLPQFQSTCLKGLKLYSAQCIRPEAGMSLSYAMMLHALASSAPAVAGQRRHSMQMLADKRFATCTCFDQQTVSEGAEEHLRPQGVSRQSHGAALPQRRSAAAHFLPAVHAGQPSRAPAGLAGALGALHPSQPGCQQAADRGSCSVRSRGDEQWHHERRWRQH